MPDTPLWKQLIHQDKLKAQYEVLHKKSIYTDKEIAIHLARFAEANILVPADDAVDAAHKVVVKLTARVQKLEDKLELTEMERDSLKQKVADLQRESRAYINAVNLRAPSGVSRTRRKTNA